MIEGESRHILLVAFLRIENLVQILKKLQEIDGANIYIWIDGPRNNEEAGIQAILRDKIQELNLNFKSLTVKQLDFNLGLKQSVISAIDWFFQKTTQGVILEDDLIVSADFFRFVHTHSELLVKHPEALLISGNNPLSRPQNSGYVISNYPLIWGWYTTAKKWETMKNLIHAPIHEPRHKIPLKVRNYWRAGKIRVNTGELSSWALPLAYGMRMNGLISISPHVNLVSNIGDDVNATHTKFQSPMMRLPLEVFKENRISTWEEHETSEMNAYLEKEVYRIRTLNIFSVLKVRLNLQKLVNRE